MAGWLSAPACIFYAVLLAYVPHAIKIALCVQYNKPKDDNGKRKVPYNVKDPRASTEEAIANAGPENGGKIRRALNAHNNQLEALPIFIGAVLVAMITGVPKGEVELVAAAYCALRVVYIWLYVSGDKAWKAFSRSITWMLCLGCCGYLTIRAAIVAP